MSWPSIAPVAHLTGLLSTAITALFVCVLLLFGVLAVMRLLVARRERRSEARKERVRPLVFNIVTGGEGVADAAWKLRRFTLPRDRRALDEVLLEIARLVDGPEKALLTGVFERMGFVDEDIRRLERGRGLERAEAAFHLGTMGSPMAVGPLLRASTSNNQTVAFSSLDALSHIGTSEALEGVMKMVSGGTGLQSSRIAEVLLERRDEFSPMVIEELEKGPGGVELKDLLVDTAGAMREPRACPVLESILLDDGETARTRAKAARALGWIGDSRACGPLSGALKERSPEVRAEAAEALGRVGCSGALVPLGEALSDQDFAVRVNAAFSLTKLGEEGRRLLEVKAGTLGETGRLAAEEALDTSAVLEGEPPESGSR